MVTLGVSSVLVLCFCGAFADIRYLDDATAEDQSGYWLGNEPGCTAEPDDCDPGDRRRLTKGGFTDFWLDGTTGDGGYCGSGKKVYCGLGDAPWEDFRWIGASSICPGRNRCNECPVGWDCIAQDRSGNGGYCARGRKVLCVDREGVGGGSPQFDFPGFGGVRRMADMENKKMFAVYTKLVFGVDLETDPSLSTLSNDQIWAIREAIETAFANSHPPVTANAESVDIQDVTPVDAELLADIPDEDMAAREYYSNFDVLFRVEIRFLTEEAALEALEAASDDDFSDLIRAALDDNGSVGEVDALVVADPQLFLEWRRERVDKECVDANVYLRRDDC